MKAKDRSLKKSNNRVVKINQRSYTHIQTCIRKLFEKKDCSLYLTHLIQRAITLRPLETFNWLGRQFREFNVNKMRYNKILPIEEILV